ncbi:hypothetical protein EVG20_g6378 [Dentipellis fragilis]|uniref:Uncharacterized protein n=1 Tax=Dentipellis fragilis TaxID=205917 RepID=A0A4Y9YL99_9AGAM|nr:hypothetical protein EVG20_g6378 [Dentipellis fragilis]
MHRLVLSLPSTPFSRLNYLFPTCSGSGPFSVPPPSNLATAKLGDPRCVERSLSFLISTEVTRSTEIRGVISLSSRSRKPVAGSKEATWFLSRELRLRLHGQVTIAICADLDSRKPCVPTGAINETTSVPFDSRIVTNTAHPCSTIMSGTVSPKSPVSPPRGDRSMSNDREFQSSGRGGAGNIRRDGSAVRHTPDGPDDFSSDFLRPRRRRQHPLALTRAPRPNLRRRRGARTGTRSHQGRLKRRAPASNNPPVAAARATSRAPTRGPTPARRSTAPDVAARGNIKPGDAIQADILELRDEEWASAHMPHVGLHSTGRGGAANITPDVPPPVDSPPHAGTPAHLAQHHTHEFESSGRGGAGNIVHSRSASRGAEVPRAPRAVRSMHMGLRRCCSA